MKGAGLFDPHALGVHPRSLSTACWRGFHCLYEVTDAAIGLRELAIGLDAGDAAKAERGELPGLAGAVPGIDLGAWANRLSASSPRFVALVLAGACLVVEPFWVAAHVALVHRLRARETGDDLRAWFEQGLAAEAA